MTTRRPAKHTKGAVSANSGVQIGNDVWLFANNGVPTNGTSGTGAGWAGPGSQCTNYATGKVYVNNGTQASPTWGVLGAQT